MPPLIPIATYRLQLTPQFGFDDAAAIIPYLKSLGISHVYASPFLKARSGTTHGYDIIDHAAFNPEFGGEPAFRRLSDALSQADLGLILDFVPNHMAVHFADNAWWLDVLEWGPRSPHAKFFDIDWDTTTGQPRVLLPILGRSYGEVLEAGEIELRYDAANGSFSAWYFEHRLPIGPNRYSEILQKVVVAAGALDEPTGRSLLQLGALYRGPRNPSRERAQPFKCAIAAVPASANIIERGLSAYRPTSSQPDAVLALHHLLERQHYRIADWRLAQSEINYRRFFDINTLAGLRVEEPEVFKSIHPLVLTLIREGRLHGLRLDHIDGLRDPHQYLRRLARDIQGIVGKRPFYIIVEKILAENEAPPRFPGVAGTTGYEWLNVISRVLLAERGLPVLDRLWNSVGGDERSFNAILRESKEHVLRTILSSEFTVLARLLARIAIGHYSTRDYAGERLREALELFIVHFPIYRTYLATAGPSPRDRAIIDATIDKCRAEWFDADSRILDFLKDALTLDLVAPGRAHHSVTRVRRFAFKTQQFTGPMMAKSLEDTAFYRYHRLLALNEVGGNPVSEVLAVEGFHARMVARAADSPLGLTATATHDTKRGEDARARILALSELAGEWQDAINRWRDNNRRWIEQFADFRPTPAHEYMIYQALVGAWPLSGVDSDFVARVVSFVVKSAREGKEQTSWYAPHERYEAHLGEFVGAILDHRRSADFIRSFGAIAERCALLGALNSLTQLTLKMTMPGIPDTYQGTEQWDLSFVDPDNRRPVDFDLRQRALNAMPGQPDWEALARNWSSGAIKLALTHALLDLRNRLPRVFLHGAYRRIEVTGSDRDHIIAYARQHDDDIVIVAAGRHFSHVTGGGRTWPSCSRWNARLHIGELQSLEDALGARRPDPSSNRELPVSGLLHTLPVAVLRGTGADRHNDFNR